MNAKIENAGRLRTVFVVLIPIIVLMGAAVALIVIGSMSLLDGVLATIVLAIAIILPIRQKRLSFFTLFLAISGLLLILSGSIYYAYHSVVSPLPLDKQIEFSKIMRPVQVSGGLSTLAFGVLYILVGFFGIQKNKSFEKHNSKLIKVLFFGMAIVGILNIVIGTTLIINGLKQF